MDQKIVQNISKTNIQTKNYIKTYINLERFIKNFPKFSNLHSHVTQQQSILTITRKLPTPLKQKPSEQSSSENGKQPPSLGKYARNVNWAAFQRLSNELTKRANEPAKRTANDNNETRRRTNKTKMK